MLCLEQGHLLGLNHTCLTLLHSERPKLYGVLAVLSAVWLKTIKYLLFIFLSLIYMHDSPELTNFEDILTGIANTVYIIHRENIILSNIQGCL